MSATLALLGGEPVRRTPFPPRRSIGAEEKTAALRVLDSGVLSAYIGGPGEFFLGGPEVKAFEAEWAADSGYRHAVTVSSWTAGLVTCVGAVGIEPGDEVICPPTTMSASATSILFYGGIPVFADIDPVSFCLDPASVADRITPRTRAIMVVHLFGGAADMDALLELARRHGLAVIEDAAQAPGATYRGRSVGALGTVGGFSLNYHKHIHTGEGGVIVTDDDTLALRCQMIRNHGENCLEAFGIEDPGNLIGSNYRLTELQAAIGRAQLGRLDGILRHRRMLAEHLRRRLTGLPGITPAQERPDSTHSYYLFPIRYDAATTGVSRARFIAAVNAELPPQASSDDIGLSGGYVKPLHLSRIYQERRALGRHGFPFSAGAPQDYSPGRCPVAERMFAEELMLSFLVREPLSPADIDSLADAIEKVLDHAAALRDQG